VPFFFSQEETLALPASERCTEDRRNNPVRGRKTLFRLLQQNMLAYTFPDSIPGFAESGINSMEFRKLIGQTIDNAWSEGKLLYRDDFVLTPQQIAKVQGDLFEQIEVGMLWNAAARWNSFMSGEEWRSKPRYSKPTTAPRPDRQVVVLGLPRGYDWVRLLTPSAEQAIRDVRVNLEKHDLSLPTSTPDIMVVALPSQYQNDILYRTEVADLRHGVQRTLAGAYKRLEGHVGPAGFILAIALKKSLRSDRLYQPLYEANIMQLLLEGKLGAPQVDFEVHTLESSGTGAKKTYGAASLAAVATGHSKPHRAVRELYEPPSAQEVVRRFLAFLDVRMAQE
jgi:hypothetical protein